MLLRCYWTSRQAAEIVENRLLARAALNFRAGLVIEGESGQVMGHIAVGQQERSLELLPRLLCVT